LNVGIGQGQVSVTPIQLVTYVARIANGGLAVKPTLIRSTGQTAPAGNAKPPALSSLGLSMDNIAIIQRGMYGCVNTPGGTATAAMLKMQDPDKKDWKMA